MPTMFVFAQSSSAVKALKVGDVVPDLVFENLVNHTSKSAKLSDFKGKVIVLDFWATWCGPCIKGMPKLSKLQQDFKDQLQVIPITHEPEAIVDKFLRRQSFKLMSAVVPESYALYVYALFPKHTIPHCIVINKEGRVAGITSSAHIDSALIDNLIHGRKTAIPQKNNIAQFNSNAPLLTPMYPELTGTNFTYSMMTGQLNGLPAFSSEIVQDTMKVGFHMVNVDITKLFLQAYQLPDWYSRSRIVLENVRDTTRYILDPFQSELYKEQWGAMHSYVYEIVAPNLTRQQRLETMKNTISTHFKQLYGAEIYPAEKELDCYALIVSDKKLLPITKGGTSMHGSDIVNQRSFFTNIPIAKFAESLEQALFLPFVDATETAINIDMTIPAQLKTTALKTKDVGALRDYLQQFGLSIEKTKRTLPVLLIREQP